MEEEMMLTLDEGDDDEDECGVPCAG